MGIGIMPPVLDLTVCPVVHLHHAMTSGKELPFWDLIPTEMQLL